MAKRTTRTDQEVGSDKPEKSDDGDTVVVDRRELEDLRARIHQTDQLIKEVSGRHQSEQLMQAKAAKMVQKFKNQRHGGKDRKYRYLVWDSTAIDEEEAEKYGKVFHSEVPFTQSLRDVLEDYNRIMQRKIVGGGKDPLKFKPLPPA